MKIEVGHWTVAVSSGMLLVVGKIAGHKIDIDYIGSDQSGEASKLKLTIGKFSTKIEIKGS